MWQYIAEVNLDNQPFTDRYLNNIPAVSALSKDGGICFNSPVTFFVGDNGTGKSTILEAIAVAFGFNAEGGSRNFTFSTAESHSSLYENIILKKRSFAKDGYFLRAESVYNLASNIDELKVSSSYGGASLHTMSHGESFLTLVQKRFGGDGLYILDEPEAALSPSKQLTLLCEINRLVNANSQLIIATHSPILMAYPGADILLFSDKGIEKVTYQDTEHYRITKDFLSSPERILKHLLQ